MPQPKGKTRTGAPDFVGVGMQRAGTTWWFDLLLGHPQIRAPKGGRKEQHFFDGFGAQEMQAADIERYHAAFPRRRGQVTGEWTPRYVGDVWALRLIKRAAPDAKILVLLRDPIERYRSGILHRAGLGTGRRKLIIAADAIERGRYGTQMKRVYELFDREQVLVLQYERCVQDPVGQYRRTLDHLGVEDHVPEDVSSLRGQSMAAAKTPLWDDLLEGLHLTFDPEVRVLKELVGDDVDLDLWPNFAHG